MHEYPFGITGNVNVSNVLCGNNTGKGSNNYLITLTLLCRILYILNTFLLPTLSVSIIKATVCCLDTVHCISRFTTF